MRLTLHVCRNCGRPLVRGRKALVHRLEDFDRSKAIDCLKPEPKEVAK